MVNGKTTSLGAIMYRVLRNPLCSEMSYDQCAEFALEYIKLLGIPLSFSDKVSDPINFHNYKAEVPRDCITVRGVKLDGHALRYASDIYHNEEDSTTSEHTYTLQNCVITTSVKEGCLVALFIYH